MKKQQNLNLLGWILAAMGLVLLLLFFVSEATVPNPAAYFLWHDMKMIGELSLPVSVVLIFGGIVLASMEIIPSIKENNTLVTHKIRFAIGEISKEQYEQMKKESER
jgi:uncharacterized membrane protein